MSGSTQGCRRPLALPPQSSSWLGHLHRDWLTYLLSQLQNIWMWSSWLLTSLQPECKKLFNSWAVSSYWSNWRERVGGWLWGLTPLREGETDAAFLCKTFIILAGTNTISPEIQELSRSIKLLSCHKCELSPGLWPGAGSILGAPGPVGSVWSLGCPWPSLLSWYYVMWPNRTKCYLDLFKFEAVLITFHGYEKPFKMF